MTDWKKIEDHAVSLFLDGGFYCSEAILKAYNEGLNIGLDEKALKMATGFGVGFGGAQCSCGSVTGAVLAASALKGRTAGNESEAPAFLAAQKIHDEFKAKYKAICCRALTKDVVWGTPEHTQFCSRYVRSAAEILSGILKETGGKENE